jgi:hypothetical protein
LSSLLNTEPTADTAAFDIQNCRVDCPADIQQILIEGQKRAETLCDQEQRLHHNAVSILLTRSANDRWQTMIEWAFESLFRQSYSRIDSVTGDVTGRVQWWQYPFPKEQSEADQVQMLEKYKSIALTYTSTVTAQMQDWLMQTRKKLDAACVNHSGVPLYEILNEPGNRPGSLSTRLLLLQDFLLNGHSFWNEPMTQGKTVDVKRKPISPEDCLKGKPKKLFDFLCQNQTNFLPLVAIYNHYNEGHCQTLTKSQKKTIKNRIRELKNKFKIPCSITLEDNRLTFSLEKTKLNHRADA